MTHTTEAEAMLFDVEGARKVLGGIGRSMVYELITGGQITPVKIGRRTLFSRIELERYCGTLSAAGSVAREGTGRQTATQPNAAGSVAREGTGRQTATQPNAAGSVAREGVIVSE